MYELEGEYYISRSNNTSIALVKKDVVGYSYIVERYVTCFCFNDEFIAVRRLTVPSHVKFEQIMEMDFNQAAYYLVCKGSGEVLGPFMEEEAFEAACMQQKVGSLGSWIPTYPAPEGARF